MDSIFFTSQEQDIPQEAITRLRQIISQRHPRHDNIVVVRSKGLLTAYLNHVVQLDTTAQSQLHFVETEAEAHAIIAAAQQRRGTPPQGI